MGRIKNIGKIKKKKLKKRASHGYRSKGIFEKRKELNRAIKEEIKKEL